MSKNKSKNTIIIGSIILCVLCILSSVLYLIFGGSNKETTSISNTVQSESIANNPANISQNAANVANAPSVAASPPTASTTPSANSQSKPINPLIKLANPGEPSVYNSMPIKYITPERLKANPTTAFQEFSYADIFKTLEKKDILSVMAEQEYEAINNKLSSSIPTAKYAFAYRNKRYGLCPDGDVISSDDKISDDVKKSLPANAFFNGFCASDLSTFRYDPFTGRTKLSKNPGMCLYAPDLDKPPNNLIAKKCDNNDPNQNLIFDPTIGKIRVKDKNICVEGAGMYEPVIVSDCNKTFSNDSEARRHIYDVVIPR